jgi:hypothetical protein
MWQFIILALVAGWTRQDKIARFACSASRNRHRMINVVSILQRRMSTRGIIAAPLLSFVLCCDVIRSVFATMLRLFSAVSSASCFRDLLAAFSLPIVTASRQNLPPMLEVTTASYSRALFWMSAPPMIFPVSSILWVLYLATSCVFSATFATPTVQPAIALFPGSKILKCARKPLIAFCAVLIGNWLVDHTGYSFAGFAIEGVDEAAKLAVHPVNYAGLVHANSIAQVAQ